MMNALDIFPRYVSENVKKLQYPEKYFKYWANDENIKPFLLFLNKDDIVYYLKQPMNKQCFDAILQIGKKCQSVDKFDPKCINCCRIKHKLSQSPIDKMRKNADHRLGFKLNNTYLVKYSFRFGLRTVEQGTAHLIQTLNAPLILYILPKKLGRVKNEQKLFPTNELHLYTQSQLMPKFSLSGSSGHQIYIIFNTKKTILALTSFQMILKYPFLQKIL